MPDEFDDSSLIRAAVDGQLDAYEQLVCRYQDLAFRTAFLITREATAAEDAAQEAFIRAFRALPKFRRGSPFRPWLLTIVSNEAKRRKAAGVRHSLLEVELTKRHQPDGSSVERQVLIGELRDSLADAVMRLSQADQMILAYRFGLDLSEAEMAAALGCPKGTVKSRLSRAMDRLRRALTPPEMEVLRLGLTYD